MPRFQVSAALVTLASAMLLGSYVSPAQQQEDQPQSGSASAIEAPKGGADILSDTQGVDFSPWLRSWRTETDKTWNQFMPDAAKSPALKSGTVTIRFKILPSGKVADQSVILEGRSGDGALDRAAWNAVVNSNYPPLPKEFHGPSLEMRASFLYNAQPH